MSLVERALKKLQETRSNPESPQSFPTQSPATVESLRRPSARVQERPAAVGVEAPVAQASVETPARTMRINRRALAEIGLLPPPKIERQIASQYQHIKRPLVAAALDRTEEAVPNANIIMMASALSGEGKTYTSINLALSMALEKDVGVLLVDADVAKPHVTRILGLENEPGLLDLLADNPIPLSSAILATDVPGLSVLPAGRSVANATELLASERMGQLAQQLANQFAPQPRGRIVLFDSPPLLLSTESRALLPAMGQIVLVVRAESTSRQAVNDAIEAIEAVAENKPINLILNQTTVAAAMGYYGYGTYQAAQDN